MLPKSTRGTRCSEGAVGQKSNSNHVYKRGAEDLGDPLGHLRNRFVHKLLRIWEIPWNSFPVKGDSPDWTIKVTKLSSNGGVFHTSDVR